MSEPIARCLEPLVAGHPCERCQAREKAVCGVLDCESLAHLKSLASTLTLSAGQTLFREGDAATRVFTLTRGGIRLHKLMHHRHRQIVGFIAEGDFLDGSVDGRRSFSADMLQDGELCSFKRGPFAAFIANHPAMERELHENAFHEVGAEQLQQRFLSHERAAERLAIFLLLLAERSGRSESDQPQFVRLPMSRRDLADYLGLNEETVSRMLSRLEVARLIRLRNPREIEFLNRPLLEELASWETERKRPHLPEAPSV